MKTKTLDADQQARSLEYLQSGLGRAGFGTTVVAAGPSSVLLDVWHPYRPGRVVQVAAVIEADGAVSYRWSNITGAARDQYGGVVTLVSRLGAMLGNPDERKFA